MDEKDKAVNTTEPAAVQTDVTPVVDDAEARIAALEAEKAKLIEEGANWKVAALKYKKQDESFDDLSDEEKMRKIASEAVADSRLADIAREQQAIITRALKENKELKLATLNKATATPPAALGSHSESRPVTDTLVTPDQLAAFKARGWSDKDIERYKKNMQRYGGR